MTNIFKGQAPDPAEKIGSLDRRTVMLASSAVFIFGSFLGCAVYRLLGIGQSELYDSLIERYFLALFQKCTDGTDVLRVVLDCMIHELWIFPVVFAAGFSPFSPFVSGILLLRRGLMFGFSATMLQFSTRTGLLMSSIVYLGASFGISMLLSLLATEAAAFCCAPCKIKLRSAASRRYLMTFFRIMALAVCDMTAMLFLIYVYI